MAYGALASGVKVVTGYPGAPSLGTVRALIELSKTHHFYVEWSCNEKVAMEMGIGASIAGRRALVCVKSVGMNLVIDPLMALNLTPVKGGLVILLGDDPGGYGSQNDQDTRPLASYLEMPLLEPATPAEGYNMVQEAFTISEKFNTAVIIRETRGFTLQEEPVAMTTIPYLESNLGFKSEPWRFVPVPKNAVEKHKNLHHRLLRIKRWTDQFKSNHSSGDGIRGVVGVGFVYQKLMDTIGDKPLENLRVFKLSSIYPLPEKTLGLFLKKCDEVLVLEEIEPYVETHMKALAYDLGIHTKIYGKQSGHISGEGELFRWQIQEALAEFLPDLKPNKVYKKESEFEERPKLKSNCMDQGYGGILDILQAAAEHVGRKYALAGDPGCLVTVAERLDAKYAIGSAVGVADGMSKADIRERPTAIFGDSSFFHTSLPAICNAVYNQSNILIIVLDNKAAVTTGFQPNPGTGKNAMGESAPQLSIEQIARSCGVKWVKKSDPDDPDSKLHKIFQEALIHDDLAMVIVNTKSTMNA
jgi:indolepyruvate ferredoxin oxidoreductase alpha subunit